MAARAMWKGVLQVGGASVPVKLFAAVQEQGVHFRLLDARHKKPVEQRMVHSVTREPVDPQTIHKGFALEDGRYVLLEPEDLETLAPAPSRDIEVSRFVPVGRVPRPYYLRPYYLGADGRDKSYAALVRALEAEKVEGIAHWVMRKRAYHGVLRAVDGFLALMTLRHADEVISAAELPRPTGRPYSDKELDMAEQLIATYSSDLDLGSFHDEYRERVLAFVEKKAEGKRVRLKKAPVKREEASLVDALSRSLKAAKRTGRAA